MFRRLRRLLRPTAPSAEAEPPAVLPTAPDERFVDADGLRALDDPLCLDLRPVSALRYGFVEGAWLLPDASRVPPTARTIVVLAEEAEAAVGLGWPVTWGGLAAWRAAGAAVREPEWKAPLPLLHRVAVSGGEGWVQDVGWSGEEFVYAVLLEDGRRVEGLVEEEVVSLGSRGAAGLGEQLER